MNITIVGMGYVGLPLAMRFCDAGHRVIGVDTNIERVKALNRRESPIEEVSNGVLDAHTSSGAFRAIGQKTDTPPQDAFIICVPTPLDKNRVPDLHCVKGAAMVVGKRLTRGALVSLESSTYPGTTSGLVRHTLEYMSGLQAGEDFSLVFSPERVDPGNGHDMSKVPKIVGGLTERCRDEGMLLYGTAFDTVVPVGSCEVAEAAKLTENIFRSVNIALVNELKVVYAAMGIDIWEVLDAAETKPFGFMRFNPGPGLGGHCIPIDPFYLTWKAREFGVETRFIELAGEINESMPRYVIHSVVAALNTKGLAVRGSKILVVGVAYKKNVADCRESPSFEIMERLQALGAEVRYIDAHVPVIQTGGRFPMLDGMRDASDGFGRMGRYDCVVIATAHDRIDYGKLDSITDTIVDTRNVMPADTRATVFKA